MPPLTFADLPGLLTKAPAELYQGGAGAGMRDMAKARMAQQDAQQRNAIDLARVRQTAVSDLEKRQDAAWKDAMNAYDLGGPDEFEVALQSLERLGYKGRRPESPGPAETTSAAEASAPELAIGAKSPTEAESNKRIDAALSEQKPLAQDEEALQEYRLTHGQDMAPDERTAPELGIPAAPPATREKRPLRTGWEIYDPNGKLVFQGNMEQFTANQRRRVRAEFDGLSSAATSPDEKRAVEIGAKAAEDAIGKMTPEKAIEAGRKAYEYEMSRQYKRDWNKYPPGYGSTAGRGTELRERSLDSQDVVHWDQSTDRKISDFETKYGVAELHKALRAGEKVGQMASSKDPLSQRSALTANLKQMFSSVTSDAEMRYALDSNGILGRVEMAKNTLVGGGAIPDEMLRQMMALAQQTNILTQRHLNDLADTAVESMDSSIGLANAPPDIIERAKENARIRISGVRRRGKASGGGKGGGSPAAKPKDVNAEVEELLK